MHGAKGAAKGIFGYHNNGARSIESVVVALPAMSRKSSRRASRDGMGALDDEELGSTVFHDEFVELDATLYRTLNEKQTSNVNYDQSSSGIESLKTVRDAYMLFGLNPDDRTHRREQVKMWKHIEGAMLAEIGELTSSGRLECYDRAKALNAALENIQAEFKGLQTSELGRNQDGQRAAFEKARHKLAKRVAAEENRRVRESERMSEKLQQDLAKLQAIERENLEHEMLIAVPGKCRFSKRVLELRRAESGLSRLHRFDEAKNVRRMIDKIEGPEKRAHAKNLVAAEHKVHDALRADQESQVKRLHERLGETKWAATRRAEREAKRERQRVKNLNLDMEQANALDRHRKPELVVHPSALLQKRAHHDVTSSTLNGKKLLDSVLGKKKDEAVYVAPLCGDHAFERPLSGTLDYRGSSHEIRG